MQEQYMCFDESMDVDLEAILDPNLLQELPIPTITDYQGGNGLQVGIKGKMLQDSKAKQISAVDAAEFMDSFYLSAVKTGLVGHSTAIYQGWLNQQEDSYLQNYVYPIALRSTRDSPEVNRHNYADGIGSICAGYGADGIPSLDDNAYLFSKPTNISTGKITNSPISWAYDLSACAQSSKLKHLFRLYLSSNLSECFYVVLFSTYDHSILGNLALNFASIASKGQSDMKIERKVHAPTAFEKPQIKNVLFSDSRCIDVVVSLFSLEDHLVQVFWRTAGESSGYLDPISSTKQKDGTRLLRVRLPNLEQDKQVWICVKAKHFDDVFSNAFAFNVTPFPDQRYITPVKASTLAIPSELQILPVQYPLQAYHANISTSSMPFQPECTAVDPLTSLQELSFNGCTQASAKAIMSQINKVQQIEDTFGVVSCSIFSGNIRTFIVCQAFHMWNMQLLPENSLLDLLTLVINHDHLTCPLSTAEMLCCLPREEIEKQLEAILVLFTPPHLHKAQHAFNQLNFVVTNGGKTTTEKMPESLPIARSSPFASTWEIPSSQVTLPPQPSLLPQPVPLTTLSTPCTPHISQMIEVPPMHQPLYTPPLVQQALPLHSQPQKIVSYEEIFNTLYNPSNVNYFVPPFTPKPTIPPHNLQPLCTTPSSILPQILSTDMHLEVIMQPTLSQAPVLTTPVQPYQIDDSEQQFKRIKTNGQCNYLQSKRQWKSLRTSYPELPSLYYFPTEPQPQPQVLDLTPQIAVPPTAQPIPSPIPQPSLPYQVPQAEMQIVQARTSTCVQAQQLALSELYSTPTPRLDCAVLTAPDHAVTPYAQETQDCAARHVPWRQRRSSAPTLSSPLMNSTTKKGKQPPPTLKVSKFANPEPKRESLKELPKNGSQKRRFFKPKREQDDDYEEDEEFEAEEEEDEEYDEVPLRRRRAPPKRKSIAETIHKPVKRFALACSCKICVVGLPSSIQKPPSWSDVAFLTLNCLGKLSRGGSKCFQLQNEIFPFIENHFASLVQTNVHHNGWKKSVQGAMADKELFVCIKGDKASLSNELWALRTNRDPWTSAPSFADPPSPTVSDSDSEDSKELSEFETEMMAHLAIMREQLRIAQEQRDGLSAELDQVRHDISQCTDSLYRVASSCAITAAPENFGVEELDQIFEQIFDDIHTLLGESANRLLVHD